MQHAGYMGGAAMSQLTEDVDTAFSALRKHLELDAEVNKNSEIANLMTRYSQLIAYERTLQRDPNVNDSTWRREMLKLLGEIKKLQEQYSRALPTVLSQLIREYGNKLSTLIGELIDLEGKIRRCFRIRVDKCIGEGLRALANKNVTCQLKNELKEHIAHIEPLLEKVKADIERDEQIMAKLRAELPRITELYNLLKGPEYSAYLSSEHLATYGVIIYYLSSSEDCYFMNNWVSNILQKLNKDYIYVKKCKKFDEQEAQKLATKKKKTGSAGGLLFGASMLILVAAIMARVYLNIRIS